MIGSAHLRWEITEKRMVEREKWDLALGFLTLRNMRNCAAKRLHLVNA